MPNEYILLCIYNRLWPHFADDWRSGVRDSNVRWRTDKNKSQPTDGGSALKSRDGHSGSAWGDVMTDEMEEPWPNTFGKLNQVCLRSSKAVQLFCFKDVAKYRGGVLFLS